MKILRCLFFTLSFAMNISINAQDLKFIGVSLEDPIDEIKNNLINKGCSFEKVDKYKTIILKGDFWKFSKVKISLWGYPNTRISVTPPSWTTVSTMNDLISSLNNKYGMADDSQSDEFHQEFRWKVGDNMITIITDFYIDSHDYHIVYSSVEATKQTIKMTKDYDNDL